MSVLSFLRAGSVSDLIDMYPKRLAQPPPHDLPPLPLDSVPSPHCLTYFHMGKCALCHEHISLAQTPPSLPPSLVNASSANHPTFPGRDQLSSPGALSIDPLPSRKMNRRLPQGTSSLPFALESSSFPPHHPSKSSPTLNLYNEKN